MGRTKGRHLHVAAKKLVDQHSGLFNASHTDNKAQLLKLGILSGNDSKEERNKLAGAIGVLMRREKAAEENSRR